MYVTSTKTGKRTQADRRATTRRALLNAARALFSQQGYAATSTEVIVRQAAVTRGALYHHFADKQDLFRTVIEEIESEIDRRVIDAAVDASDPVQAFIAGSDAFLDLCLEPDVKQILLLDGPAVLGWREWHAIDVRHAVAQLERGLGDLIEAGCLVPQPILPLAILIHGALIEAGLTIAVASDGAAERAALGASLQQLLGLRSTPPPIPGKPAIKEHPLTLDQISGSRLLSRRTLLRGGGAATILVASGGVWRAVDQGVFSPTTGPAFAPWHDWQASGATGPLALVPAAILAANAHNTQPWRFRVEESRIDLIADPARSIGAIDPFSRERDISLGCALENLLLAARAYGFDYRLQLTPDSSDHTFMARVDLTRDEVARSPLYDAIPRRHTNRYPYDAGWQFPQEMRNALDLLTAGDDEVSIGWFTSDEQRQHLRALLVAASEAINSDREQAHDNIDRWLRQDADDVQRHRDGLTLDAAGLSWFNRVAAKMLPQQSLTSSSSAWLAAEKEQASTAAAFGVLTVRDPRSAGQRMKVGRLWQRLHLWLTDADLAAQPMNQFHERVDREEQLGLEPTFTQAVADLLDDPGR